jgi:hypothetical protein
MPNLNLRRFSDPGTLTRIKRESLLQWLQPAQSYLAGHGVRIPSVDKDGPLDLDALAGIFIDPESDMPAYLVDSLFFINEMADQQGMDAILEAVEARGLDLEIGDMPTPVDVAVQVWLKDKDLLESIHNTHLFSRLRGFRYFETDARPVPHFAAPSSAQLNGLQARLDNWFAKKKRGRGCRVFAYPKDGECWFLVRHGLPCKREGTMDTPEGSSIFYRPQKYDVLVYNAAAGEIRVNCCGRRELEEFRKAFGAHLFGNEAFFPGTAKYKLDPLVCDGPACLACGDIPGIEHITLKEVEFYQSGQPWQRIIRKSEDIFELVANGLIKWPAVDRIKRAGFEIKFADSTKTRRVTLIPSNKALYARDDDSALVEQWLKARGFLDENILEEESEEQSAAFACV